MSDIIDRTELSHTCSDNYEDFRQDINSILLHDRDPHDRYKLIYEHSGLRDIVLIYCSIKTRQITKVVINYDFYSRDSIIEIFSEDTTIEEILKQKKSYTDLVNTISIIREFDQEERLFNTLKYGK